MSANLGGFISATFDPLAAGKPETVEYLVVAGGGGGAAQNNSGGGGGAGGLLTAVNFAVTAGANNTITVGAGGAGMLHPGECTRGCAVQFREGILLTSQRSGAAPPCSPRYQMERSPE